MFAGCSFALSAMRWGDLNADIKSQVARSCSEYDEEKEFERLG